jgi:hypothetical protein
MFIFDYPQAFIQARLSKDGKFLFFAIINPKNQNEQRVRERRVRERRVRERRVQYKK